MRLHPWLIATLAVLFAMLFFVAARRTTGGSVPEVPNELGSYLVFSVSPGQVENLRKAIEPLQDRFHLQLVTSEVEANPWQINLPAGTLPIIAIPPRKPTRPSLREPIAQPDIPSYHVDFDPLHERTIVFPGDGANSFLHNFQKIAPTYFVSDGNTRYLSAPEDAREYLDRYRLPSHTKIRWWRSAKEFREEEIPDREAVLREKKTSRHGIYITSSTAQRSSFFKQLRSRAKNVGIDTLVIDMKSFLARPYLDLAAQHKLLQTSTAEASPWLKNLVKELHQDGFQVTGRVVVFKEDHLVLIRPDLGVQNRATGGVWRDRKGGRWLDPYSEEAQHFNYLISLAAAASGVDEIQFDYIRFPTDGDVHNIRYPHQDSSSHVKVVMDYLRKVRHGVEPYKTSLALDIFGVTAWQSAADIVHLGQDLRELSMYLDVISPMFYPSHFHAGYDGFANPGSHPYYFMNKGIRKSKEILAGRPIQIVPWIQGFNLKSPHFGPGYIREQIRACGEENIDRYLIWNARNVYDAALSALRPSQ